MRFLNTIPRTKIQCVVVCFQALSVVTFNSYADELDTFQFSSSVKSAWDNNLFKRSSNESSDQITTYSAGIKFDKTYSLQRVTANIDYINNKYKNNDFLNFDTVNYDLAWQWTLTPALTGVLSRSKAKSLSGFSDFRNFTQNIRTTETNQFRAEYSPHRVWRMIAGVTNSTATNSQVFNFIPNFEFTGLDYGAGYNFASGSSITFMGHKREGSYNRDINIVGFIDKGYTEEEYELDLLAVNPGKSNITAKIAYLARDYDNFTNRNYGAWNGYLRYDLLLTGKLQATAGLYRTVSVFESSYSSYSQTDAFISSIDYKLTSKFTIGLNARIAQRNFKQPTVSGIPKRSDDELSFGGGISWEPTRYLTLGLTSTKSMRDSNGAYNSFDYDDITTALSLDFKI